MAESFLPHMNGVTGSVLHILRHLERRGHQALVLAPRAEGMPAEVHGARIEPAPSMALPGYRDVRVGAVSTHRVAAALERFDPDIVHLASPFALGWRGVLAAGRLGVPTVAAYQTDVAGYTERYRLPVTTALAQNHVSRLHKRATLTLSPSRASDEDLARWGVDRVRRWGRGVDAERFHPSRRNEAWQRPNAASVIIGYVGRLAAEKQVEDLRALQEIRGTRLVIFGDGPLRSRLEAQLPRAVFLGHLGGDALAEALASFDIFVHPGESDTFGQTLQEAHASGVPVVATGRGGPRDLVRMGIDGWLYEPGDLEDMRMRVADLAGDAAKRRAFGVAGRAAVEQRSWEAICDQLLGHFATARELHLVDRSLRAPRERRPEPVAPVPHAGWHRYVALGDSLTEGLCDPAPDGTLRGWADRLAYLLSARGGLHYANLAVRSRRVRDVCGPQLARARELRPDLVSILVGANDLVKRRLDVAGFSTPTCFRRWLTASTGATISCIWAAAAIASSPTARVRLSVSSTRSPWARWTSTSTPTPHPGSGPGGASTPCPGCGVGCRGAPPVTGASPSTMTSFGWGVRRRWSGSPPADALTRSRAAHAVIPPAVRPPRGGVEAVATVDDHAVLHEGACVLR